MNFFRKKKTKNEDKIKIKKKIDVIKILLLGDTCVGKSSILNRYVKNYFDELIVASIGKI